MIKVLTFDCYGTLIDWEGGMRASLESVVQRTGLPAPWETLTAKYIEVEMDVEAEPYRPYREVLQIALRRTFESYGFEINEQEQQAFVDSIRSWPPFAETQTVLESLIRKGKQLAILSNIDNDIIRESVQHIGVPFDWIISAEDVNSYKPAHGHWTRFLEISGVPKERILHVGASALHDIRPAKEIGFRSVWVNRTNEPSNLCEPDSMLSDLRKLPELV